MPKWGLTGVLLTVALFFVLVGVILSNIKVDNPYDDIDQSVIGFVIDSVNPFSAGVEVEVTTENGTITGYNGSGNIIWRWLFGD